MKDLAVNRSDDGKILAVGSRFETTSTVNESRVDGSGLPYVRLH